MTGACRRCASSPVSAAWLELWARARLQSCSRDRADRNEVEVIILNLARFSFDRGRRVPSSDAITHRSAFLSPRGLLSPKFVTASKTLCPPKCRIDPPLNSLMDRLVDKASSVRGLDTMTASKRQFRSARSKTIEHNSPIQLSRSDTKRAQRVRG